MHLRIILSTFTILLAGCATTRTVNETMSMIGDINPFGEQSPIATQFKDAVTEVVFLDNFNPPPASFLPMTATPRQEDGGYRIGYGLYALDAQSYCIQALAPTAPAKAMATYMHHWEETKRILFKAYYDVLRNQMFRKSIFSCFCGQLRPERN